LACRIDAIETIPTLPAWYRVLVHHWIAVWVVYHSWFLKPSLKLNRDFSLFLKLDTTVTEIW